MRLTRLLGLKRGWYSRPKEKIMGEVRTLASSEARTAANRRNAQRSTGPRTPEGRKRSSRNARRHGEYSAKPWTPQFLETQGGNSAGWIKMYQQFLREWQPEGPAEALLVEDLANLYWAKTGLRRVQAAEAANDVQQGEFADERRELQRKREPSQLRDSTRVGLAGLRSLPECPEKYGPALELIDRITELAVSGGKNSKFDPMFELLYGIHPTNVGLDFQDVFRQFAADGKINSCANAEEIRAKLRSLMAEERATLLAERDLDEREDEAEYVVAEDTFFVPTQRWANFEDQDAALDRRIEHKIRVLVALQRNRRARDRAWWAAESEPEPEGQAEDSSPDPAVVKTDGA
jgi:hypothetical protein